MLSYGLTCQTAWKEVIGMKEEGYAFVWAYLSDSAWKEVIGMKEEGCAFVWAYLSDCMEISYWDEGGGACFRMGLPLRLHGKKCLG